MDPTTPNITDAEAAAALGLLAVFGIIALVAAVIGIIIMWKLFTKAGQPGWASIVPIYNIYILTKIVGRPGWWTVLMLIPVINIIPAILISIDLAKSFGKDTVFAIVGLILFSVIGYAILAFGSAQYRGPAALAPAPHPAY